MEKEKKKKIDLKYMFSSTNGKHFNQIKPKFFVITKTLIDNLSKSITKLS